ncbi:MAG: hypothetical protein ACKORY_09030 [Actinomycetota bacterium]
MDLIPYAPEDGCFYNDDSFDLSGGVVSFTSSTAARTVEITVMDELRRTAVTSLTLP